MATFPRLTGLSPSVQAAGAGGRVRRGIAVLLAVALAAGATGALIGRATKSGGNVASPATWQALPRSPLSGRLAASGVWTGKEMIVWGGVTKKAVRAPGSCDRCASDGAAYDPVTRSWRTIASAPAGVEGGAAVAWTGREMIVWASNSPDGPTGAAAYDPAKDSWRRLPAGPLGNRESFSSIWTGKELVVVGGNRGDTLAKPVAAALDPRTGAWRLLPALNRLAGLMPSPGLAWDGHEAFVLDSVCTANAAVCTPMFVRYDPASDTLRRIDVGKAPIVPKEQQLTLIGWSGTDVVFSTVGVPTNVNSGRILIVRYDPVTGRWRRAPFAPFPETAGVYEQTAWLGDRFVAPDGSSALQIYSLATDSWRTITPGPSPLNSRAGSVIVWTGADLIVWSGTVYERFNPTPADGASLTLGS